MTNYLIQSKFLVKHLAHVLKGLNLSTSGKKAEQKQRLLDYLSTGVRNQDEFRIEFVCNLAIKEMYDYFADELDAIMRAARITHNIPRPTLTQTTRDTSSSAHSNPTWAIFFNERPYSKSPTIFVDFEPSPFYQLGMPVTDFIETPIVSKSEQCSIRLKYQFESEQAKLAKQGKVCLMLLAGNVTEARKTSGHTPVAFPSQLAVTINGQPYTENLKGLKGKLGTAKPADLTKYTSKTSLNTIDVGIVESAEPFVFRLYWAIPSSVDDLIDQVKTRPVISKHSTVQQIKGNGTDDDIEEISTVLPLRCPLSYARIQTPVRSIHCDHVECFDLTSFIQLQQQATTWTCPICNKGIKFLDLAVDEYMSEILAKAQQYDISEIELSPDGEWRLPADAQLLESDDDYSDDDSAPPPKSGVPSKSSLPNDAVVISLDSDGEEIDSTPPPPPPSSGPKRSNSISGQVSIPYSTTQDGNNNREDLVSTLPTWNSSLFGHHKPKVNNRGVGNVSSNPHQLPMGVAYPSVPFPQLELNLGSNRSNPSIPIPSAPASWFNSRGNGSLIKINNILNGVSTDSDNEKSASESLDSAVQALKNRYSSHPTTHNGIQGSPTDSRINGADMNSSLGKILNGDSNPPIQYPGHQEYNNSPASSRGLNHLDIQLSNGSSLGNISSTPAATNSGKVQHGVKRTAAAAKIVQDNVIDLTLTDDEDEEDMLILTKPAKR